MGLIPLEPQSRFGDKTLKFHVVCSQLSPKRDCSPEGVNGRGSAGSSACCRCSAGLIGCRLAALWRVTPPLTAVCDYDAGIMVEIF